MGKVFENYLKMTDVYLINTAIRALTGVPKFTYYTETNPEFNPVAVFALISAAD